MVGLGKSKLPKAGLEHREILPPSSCEDRDYGWVAGSQQSPIENLQVDSTTINQSRRKDLYIMYIGLGTLQTVYCILCNRSIILAMSTPIILINNNNTPQFNSQPPGGDFCFAKRHLVPVPSLDK